MEPAARFYGPHWVYKRDNYFVHVVANGAFEYREKYIVPIARHLVLGIVQIEPRRLFKAAYSHLTGIFDNHNRLGELVGVPSRLLKNSAAFANVA